MHEVEAFSSSLQVVPHKKVQLLTLLHNYVDRIKFLLISKPGMVHSSFETSVRLALRSKLYLMGVDKVSRCWFVSLFISIIASKISSNAAFDFLFRLDLFKAIGLL